MNPGTATDDIDDPFEAHFRRETRARAAIRILGLTRDAEAARPHAEALAALVRERKRTADVVLIALDPPEGRAAALRRAVAECPHPLLIVTSALEPWTAAHLDPLLESINHCDHAFGRRPQPPMGRFLRWLGNRVWRFAFAVPVDDVHSPCRIHRIEALRTIVFQSAGPTIDVELIAKATFLGHLIDEVPVPALAGPDAKSSAGEAMTLFNRPAFVEASGPAEDAQGEEKRDDGPDRQDDQAPGHVDQAGALKDDRAHGVEQLGQR